jgi:Ca-activated chloride channel family protein
VNEAEGDEMNQGNPSLAASNQRVAFTVEPERRLIRPSFSHRHLVFGINVAPAPAAIDRTPVSIALVLDRSGSMQGEKLATACWAVRRVVDALDERDRIAVVVFDSEIDLVQPAAPVTPSVKQHVHHALAGLLARSSTALRDGWLTGCEAIAANDVPRRGGGAHCFLLTDGQANVGEQDPEKIASQAAGVHMTGGVSTSTFGIGPDYNEALLGPMAVGGGGQFHHLRSAADIIATFEGELGDLFASAATNVRLEIEAPAGCGFEVVSLYRSEQQSTEKKLSLSVDIGNLAWGTERPLVVRVAFPKHGSVDQLSVRSRLTWAVSGEQFATDWYSTPFTYASDAACKAEAHNPSLLRTIGLQHASKAKVEAATLNGRGELTKASDQLKRVAKRIREYEGNDPELKSSRQDLDQLAREFAKAVMESNKRKELYSSQQRNSRGQTDYRQHQS